MRGAQVRLTADGRRLAERIAAQAYGALSHLLDVLSARDRARLGVLADRVVREHARLDQTAVRPPSVARIAPVT